jgi:hypothetical protein
MMERAMDGDGKGIHVYGTPDPDNPGPPAEGGMRGERTGDQNRIDRDDSAEETPGGLDPEKVEARPNVGEVTPEDYPADERAEARVDDN